jgi:hypothetical protein
MIETLVVGAVWAVGQRVGERWLDDFAAVVDDRLRAGVKQLAVAVGITDPSRREAEAAVARAELDHQVRSDPALATQLAQTPLPAPQPQTRIDQFAAFLEHIFELAARLRRPVALPGFFNCTSCVTIIDARPAEQGGNRLQITPSNLGGETTEDATLWFASDLTDVYQALIPRVWLIRTADDSRRDALIGELNSRFWPGPPSTSSFGTFYLPTHDLARTLHDGERVERVRGVDRDRVLADAEDRPPGTKDERIFYAIKDPAGLKLMRDALAEHVTRQMQVDGDFERTLGGAQAP